MSRKKVTIVGAGNVGASLAQALAITNLADVVLIDILKRKECLRGKPWTFSKRALSMVTIQLLKGEPIGRSSNIPTSS